MEAIGYGILIAALIVAAAFGGFILCMRVKGRDIRYMPLLGDTSEQAEIQKRGFNKAFNLEDLPPTAEGFAKRFKRPASEELKRATRLEDQT